jgi:universal stress protein F
MYSNILIPVVADEGHDNKTALNAAQALASSDARFTLLHVIEPIPSIVSSEIPGDVLNRAREEIARAMDKLGESLPNAKVQLISGHAGRSIVDYANQYGSDCIIVASHRPGFGDYFLGSTAARVVRFAQCSVHVVR